MHHPEADCSPTGNGPPLPVSAPAPVTRELQQRALNHLARPAALSTTPNAVALLLALRRRWLLAVTLGLVLAPAAAAAAWFSRPITFTARFLLEVKSSRVPILYELREGSDFSNYQRMQIALVRSRLVLNSALRDPKVSNLAVVKKQEDPVAWLESVVGADFGMAPEILRISMTGEDTEALPIIVDAVRKAYMVEIVQKEFGARDARLKKLKDYYADYDTKLHDKKEALRGMIKAVGTKSEKTVAARQEFNDRFLHQLESELLKLRSDLGNAELDVVVQEERKKAVTEKSTVPEAQIEQLLKQDLIIKGLHQKIIENEMDIERFLERSPDAEKEPGYQGAKKAVAAAKAGIKKRGDELRPTIIAQLRGKTRDEHELQEFQMRDRVAFLKLREKHLLADIDRFGTKITRYNNDAADMGWLQDEVADLEAVRKEIAGQKQRLEVEMTAPSRVKELEEEVVVLPAQTMANRIRFAGGAGFGAFALALLGVAFLEFRLRRVGHADDISQGLKMRLVGSLPLVPRRALMGRGSQAQNAQWQHRLMESVDSIRATLLNAARFEGLRRVMVTSAVGGEGKTLLSAHLAVSLARAGCRTLLIDGDLRRPSVHKLFNMPLGQGLSDLLRGDAAPGAVVNAGPLETLAVLTAGQSDSRAIQNLARDRLVEVLKQVSQDYEFVIIDSAPILPVADAQLIGQHVDGVVLSVMRDVSRLPAVYAAYERLALLRVRILGAVVSGGDASYSRSSYYSDSPTPAQAPTAEKASA